MKSGDRNTRSHAEFRAHLEREVSQLSSDDQLRVMRLIQAMQEGANIDPSVISKLTPDQLREWSDQLADRKG